MKTYRLIASVAAIMLTFASLSAVDYNVALQSSPAAHSSGVHPVINLAPVLVHPSAAERRAAALLTDATGIATPPALGQRLTQTDSAPALSLLESEVAMPYYSFGKKFGRASKE